MPSPPEAGSSGFDLTDRVMATSRRSGAGGSASETLRSLNGWVRYGRRVDPLQRAALLWAVDEQPAEDLPDLAADLLVQGVDSPSLRELAGAPRDDFWQVKELFEATLLELGVDVPQSEQASLWALAQRTAQEIVDGDRSPTEGATWIWRHLSNRIIQEGDLRVFVGFASEFEDHPEDGPAIGAAIVDAAAELLTRSEPRMWLRVQARHGMAPVVQSGTRAPVSLHDLPITDDAANAVAQWASQYDLLFDTCDAEGGFANEHDAEAFVEQGRQLVTRLQSELGDSWHVEYMPEATKPPGLRLRTRQT